MRAQAAPSLPVGVREAVAPVLGGGAPVSHLTSLAVTDPVPLGEATGKVLQAAVCMLGLPSCPPPIVARKSRLTHLHAQALAFTSRGSGAARA